MSKPPAATAASIVCSVPAGAPDELVIVAVIGWPSMPLAVPSTLMAVSANSVSASGEVIAMVGAGRVAMKVTVAGAAALIAVSETRHRMSVPVRAIAILTFSIR